MNDSSRIPPAECDTAPPDASAAEIAAIVQKQRAHFASGATLPLAARRAALAQLRRALLSHESNLLAAVHADLRKPWHEAYASEIALVIAEADYAAKRLPRWIKGQRRSVPWMIWPARGRVVRRPMGVSLILGPWNYPVQLLLLPLVGAIAGGNTAIIKPSELAPHSSRAMASMIADAFAPQHVACVEGDQSVAAALLDQRFDTIFFTGSASVGRRVAAAAAKNLTPVTLELGGKCPAVVCADANLAMAARRIVWAKCMNAGQTCVAPDYLLVQRSVRGPLIEQIIKAIHEMYGADVQASDDFGRIVNDRHFQRLLGYLTDGTIAEGGQHDATQCYLAPTLLVDVRSGSRILEEEIFGPILPILPFDAEEEATDWIAARPPPLAVYLFTRRQAVVEQFQQRVACGGICINDLVVQLLGRHLPFGGVRESGMGRYHGRSSFDCFTFEQTIVRCSTRIDPPFRYPPPKLSLKRLRQALPWLLRG